MRRAFSLVVGMFILTAGIASAQVSQGDFDALAVRVTALEKIVLPQDTTAPTVAMTAPVNAATVSGTTVEVRADASDDVGIVGVQFKLNGANLMGEELLAPYYIQWNTTLSADGTYTLTAVARDAAGNTTTSASREVTVDNAPPPPDTTLPTVVMTAPINGANVSGTAVLVSATASDNVAVVGVQFKLDGANLGAEDTTSPHTVTWNSTLATDGAHALTATARDAAGNTRTSLPFSVTVGNTPPPPPGDTTAPTVALTAPANAATVSGATVAITATASDNVGVVGVRFKVNAVNQGAEDLATPFAITWDTTGFTNGSYSLTATARDAAGNTTTSAARTVTVSNTAPPPPPPPPPGGSGNQYFDSLVKRADHLRSWSLRTQASINSVAQSVPQTAWVYDAARDAAKGTITGFYPSDSDIRPQLWFPLNITSGNVVVIWDYFRGAEWEKEPVGFTYAGSPRPGLLSLKAFQVRRPPNQIMFEIRNHFSGATGAGNIATIDMRHYGQTRPGTSRNADPYGANSDTIQPLLVRTYVRAKWLRYVWKFEVNNPAGTDRVWLWVIEEGGSPVQIYNDIQFVNEGGLSHFDFEEDASQGRAPGSPPLVTFGRNVVVLQNVSNPSAAGLLVAPVP